MSKVQLKTCSVCGDEKKAKKDFNTNGIGAVRRAACIECEKKRKRKGRQAKKDRLVSEADESVDGDADEEQGNLQAIRVPDSKDSVILEIGDIHHPFQHQDYLDFLCAVRDEYQPDFVCCLGDEIDGHALSDYVHDPDGMSPGDEHAAALKGLHRMYKEFEEVYVCESNHTERPFKRAYKAGIPKRFLRDYAEILEAPSGWRWAEAWIIDETYHEHGESFGGYLGALKHAEKNLMSTWIGHNHSSAGVLYMQTPSGLLFGANAGCLVNRKKYAFAYTKHDKAKPVIAAGVSIERQPRIHTMRMDKHARWIGKL